MLFSTLTLCVGLTAVSGALVVPRDDHPVPKFPDAYSAEGFILLPYVKIVEKFTANFDKNQQKSRIDYNDKTMMTFQISNAYTNAPNGAEFKIVWTPNRLTDIPEQICYQTNASAPGEVEAQSIFPDLTGFTYVGDEDCKTGSSNPELIAEGTCSKWSVTLKNETRDSTYSFWARQINNTLIPARYSMFGFDSLFGSHYDDYQMIYTSVSEGDQNSDVFDAIQQAPKKECVPFPEGSGLSTGHLFNPMREFVHRDESHLQSHFNHFKKTHGKSYGNVEEEALRKNHFRHNQRLINSMNRKNKEFKLKINHLADLHQDEMRALRGRKFVAGFNGGSRFPEEKFVSKTLPPSVDWRTDSNVVSPVKDQAICGSCWSFGTTGHLESMYFLKHNTTVSFSEQQLVDCSWNFGNGGCDGGMDFQAYRYIMQYGLSTDDQYGTPYLGIDGKCHEATRTIDTLIGYTNVTGNDNLKKAVAFVGPISVGIDAALATFSFYSEGVFSDPNCKNGVEDLDHAVLAVGYGTTSDGVDYWIVKNSWSTHWGDNGFIKIAQKGNICGVSTQATYAILP